MYTILNIMYLITMLQDNKYHIAKYTNNLTSINLKHMYFVQIVCFFKTLITKQPSCEKRCRAQKYQCEKCEIKCGGQEMAAMILMPIILMIALIIKNAIIIKNDWHHHHHCSYFLATTFSV